MKARVERDALAKALKTVLPAAGGHMAVLNGVHMEASESAVTLTCSNLDLTITADVAAADTTKGIAIAPASLLTKIVGSFGDGAVELEDADGMLRVACGETVADLHTINALDWPRLPEASGSSVELSAEDVERVARILPFASTETNRSLICAVHFAGGVIEVTDSYRLGCITVDAEFPEALVPASALAAIVRNGGPLVVTIGDRIASFSTQQATSTVRLTEGDYPNLAAFDRKTSPHSLTFATAPLLEALRRLDPLADLTCPVRFTRDGDKVNLEVHQADVGSLTDVVPCSGDFDGPIQFHGRYLAEMITATNDDEVTFELSTHLQQAIVRSERLFQALMPNRMGL